jgi:hypothetical protein
VRGKESLGLTLAGGEEEERNGGQLDGHCLFVHRSDPQIAQVIEAAATTASQWEGVAGGAGSAGYWYASR